MIYYIQMFVLIYNFYCLVYEYIHLKIFLISGFTKILLHPFHIIFFLMSLPVGLNKDDLRLSFGKKGI